MRVPQCLFLLPSFVLLPVLLPTPNLVGRGRLVPLSCFRNQSGVISSVLLYSERDLVIWIGAGLSIKEEYQSGLSSSWQQLLVKFFKLFLYFWLPRVFISVCRLSLVVVSRVYSLVAVCGLIAVASLVLLSLVLELGASVVAVCGFSIEAPRLRSTGSVVVAHRLSCSIVRGIFPDQRSNLCLLPWQVNYLPRSHQESP